MDTASIDSRKLYSRLGSPTAPLLLDVRREPAFESDSTMVAGALRPKGGALAYAAAHAQGRPVIVYCVHGHQVGRDAAMELARAGFDAAYLEGGIEAWRALGLPTIRRNAAWRVPGGSRWITRARPKIDRIACPWLIRRFLDPLAQFDYVPAGEVIAEAKARDAVPYDVEGVQVTHRQERCSFDALIEDFALRDPALDHLARIVRGADTNRPELAAQCAGLLAASLGLSRQYADDHEMLHHALPLYDGLYAWCRAEADGATEGHSWNPGA